MKKRILLIIIPFIILFSSCSVDSEERMITNIDSEELASENSIDEDAVVIDGVEYSGYKGPVQGEIKYEEGRPADENSLEYKASGDIKSPYKINLVVTENYGHGKIFEKNVGLVKDEVGMEVMFRNLDIKTAYGGGFVNSINGIESKYTFYTGNEREKRDWFYWINGILAPIGVAEYRPAEGDTIWWDYHDWNTTMFIPAVIGSYPEPFRSGIFGKNPGTIIYYTKEFEGKAKKLKATLEKLGVESVEIFPFDPLLIEDQERYEILIGKWDDISKESKYLNKLNEKNKFLGIYVKFEDGKMYSLNGSGEKIDEYGEDTGCIYATAPGVGGLKPTWVVTGIDSVGVNLALETLISDYLQIDRCFGVIVGESTVENIPYIE